MSGRVKEPREQQQQEATQDKGQRKEVKSSEFRTPGRGDLEPRWELPKEAWGHGVKIILNPALSLPAAFLASIAASHRPSLCRGQKASWSGKRSTPESAPRRPRVGQGKHRRIHRSANRPRRTSTHSLKEKNNLVGKNLRDSAVQGDGRGRPL